MSGAAGAVLGAADLECDRALLAIAAHFEPATDASVVDGRLDEAGRVLFGVRYGPVGLQAWRVAGILSGGLCLRPDAGDPRGLLVGAALRRRTAHPILLAAVGHEVARRAGLESHVCTVGPAWCVALHDGQDVAVVPCGGALPPGRRAPQRRCPHEVAYALLHALRGSAPAWREDAERLMEALPLRA
jgi:hypothetical protein